MAKFSRKVSPAASDMIVLVLGLGNERDDYDNDSLGGELEVKGSSVRVAS